MTLLLYLGTAGALLRLSHRWIRPIAPAAALVLALLPLCFTGRALLTDRVYAPIELPYATEPLQPMRGPLGVPEEHNPVLSDLYTQMIPWRQAVRDALARGEWPLWNPSILSGDILAAAAQPAAYSPFTLLACLLPIELGLTYTAAIAFFVAGLGAFLFVRELGCREEAAYFAAAGFMFSSAVSFFILWPLGFSWALFPLVLLGVRRVVRDPGVRSGAVLLAAFTLLLVAGHPESVLHVVTAGALYGAFELARVRRAAMSAVATAVAGGVLALALTAVYLLPVLDAVEQTAEHEYRRTIWPAGARGVHLHSSLARLAVDVLPALHLRAWKLETANMQSVDSAAVGSIILALAIFAVIRVRSADTWFFGALCALCLLARMNCQPVAQFLARLPLFDLAINERFSFGAAACLAVLAAHGVEALLRRDDRRTAAVTLTIVLLGIAGGTIALQHLVGPERHWAYYKPFAEIAFLGSAVLLLGSRLPLRAVTPLLLGLLLAQRTLSEGAVYPTHDRSHAYPPVPLFEPLKGIGDPFRVIGFDLLLIPGTSTLYGLEDPRGYQAMTLKRYADTYPLWCKPQPAFFNKVDDLTRPFLSFLNVRFAVAWTGYEVPEGWRIFARQRGAVLLENTRVIERAFVPRRVRTGFPREDTINQMAGQSDFRDLAWIEGKPLMDEWANGPGHVRTLRREAGYDLEVEMENAGWIVVSQAAWKGWRADAGGRRLPVRVANGAFLGIHVPKGRHTVRLRFRPESFVIGRAITMATLIGVAAFGIGRAVILRRSPRASSRSPRSAAGSAATPEATSRR